MKKGYYFYTLLTKEEQQELKKETGSILKHYLQMKHEDLDFFISGLFMWKHSKKGHEYWSNISKSIRTHKQKKLKF